jgi:hypothetical protein
MRSPLRNVELCLSSGDILCLYGGQLALERALAMIRAVSFVTLALFSGIGACDWIT